MNKPPYDIGFSDLFETIAAYSVLIDTQDKNEVGLFMDSLKELKIRLKQKGMKDAEDIVGLFLNILAENLGKGSDKLRDIVALGMNVLRLSVFDQQLLPKGASAASLLKDKFDVLLSEKAPPAKVDARPAGDLDIKVQKTKAKAAEEYLCQVPVIDVSENKDVLSDFINEARDHLVVAEESLLSLEHGQYDREEINRIFRAFHTIKGVAGFLNLADIKNLSHETETMMDLVRSKTLRMEADVVDAAFSSVDAVRKLVGFLEEQVRNNGKLKSSYYDIAPLIRNIRHIIAFGFAGSQSIDGKEHLGQILVENKVIEESQLDLALELQNKDKSSNRLGEILVDLNAVTPGQLNRALQEQLRAAVTEQIVKIGVNKLDNLVDMVGELVIIGTQIFENPHIKLTSDERLSNDVGQLERIIRNIQDISMSMRLIPIRPLFQKMQRFVRDMSRKYGKPVDVKLFGEDTEIDKNMVDLLHDPIMHMVRNAIDHGIEDLKTREKAGKSASGMIELHAFHKADNIVIAIRDDGRGLNKEKIIKKAVSMGLLKEKDSLPEAKVYNMIFEPGFSTAEKVTEASGRGVGMDVVKRNIEQMRGKIDIATEEQHGCTFILKLPLTLAIIDGIIIVAGGKKYILPIYSIVEFFSPKAEDIICINGKPRSIKFHGHVLQLIMLEEYVLGEPLYNDITEAVVCVVESDYGEVCFLVDGILGQQQVVIKTLGAQFNNIKGIAGGAILGDGTVGIILDVNGIIRHLTGEDGYERNK